MTIKDIKIKDYNKQRIFKIFNPGKNFPAISISGSECELDCAHCGGYYLNHMLVADSPQRLIALCNELAAGNATGALISGGCDAHGHVILEPYFDALMHIKRKTGLILNIHTGLITETQAQHLAKTGVDVASVDVVGDESTIKDVYGLDHSPSIYRDSLLILKNNGIKKIVPHICIGLNYGKITGEFKAIDMISEIEPLAIVFIILIPTKGSKMAQCTPPEISDVIEVIRYARERCKNIPLYLGCMRPRAKEFRKYSQALEKGAIDLGIDGIVLPSKSTVKYIQNKPQKIIIEKYNTCCAII
jgi:uncharacterized radical SAM superfamily protein